MRRKTTPRPPMLVMRGLRNDQLELRERAAVQAFALGYATTEHYHILADMHSVMLLASKAHESMMQEGRGLYLWGIETPVRDVQEFCTRFAALVAEDERERLAQHCESPKRTEKGWWSLTAEEIRKGAPE